MSGSNNPVLSLEVQDNLTPGAAAATDALNKLADSADTVEQKVTRVSVSASTLVNRFDPATKSINALERAQRQLVDATDTLARSVAAGDTTQTQASNTIAALQARVRALQDAAQAAAGSVSDLAASYNTLNRINAATGVSNAPLAADSYATRAADIEAYGNELDRLRAKYNPLFAVSKQYEAELAGISNAQKVGAISASEASIATDRATKAFSDQVNPAKDLGVANASLATAHGGAARAADGASMAHAGFTRELIILGHEITVGNYNRIPGSIMVLAERTGNLNQIVSTIGSALMGWPGIMLAAGAGLTALAVNAEHSADRFVKLQTALQAVNGGGNTSLAQTVNVASRTVAQTGLASLADATTAATAFANNPAVIKSAANIERLVTDSNNLAAVTGETLPAAAAKLAAALDEPGKMADELAKTHFAGMNAELARSITLQAESGDKAGAFATLLGVVEKATHDAANTSKTELQKALADLSGAFVKTGADGKTFAQSIGDSVNHILASTVENLTAVVKTIESAYNLVTNLHLPDWMVKSIGGAASGVLNPIGGLVSTASTMFGGSPSPMSTGIITGSSLQLPTAVSNQIYDLAQRLGASGSQADFATRIAYQESHGRQFNSVGGVLTSSTGAQGLFQLMPSTAAGLGVDASDQSQNIAGGITYAVQMLNRYGGNEVLAAAAYNWGPGNVDKYLKGVATTVPKETQDYVKSVTGADITRLAGPASASGAVIDVSGATPVSVNNSAQIIQDALAKAVGGTSTGALENAKTNVKDYTAALAALAAQGETSGRRVDILTEALTKATKAQFDAIGPAAQLIRALKEQTAQQDELAAAWSGGYAAEAQVVAQVKAEQQARTVAAPDTAAYTDAVERLTAAQLALAAAQQSVQAGAALADQAQQVQYLQAETTTLGESANLRARDLAVLKEQQTIEKTLPGISQQQKDALLAGAAAIADQNTNLQQTQAALQEVGNLATQAFDQIGSAISNSFLSGTGAAINWGNTVKAVVGTVIQQVAKLAILNPIINTITGGNSPTLLSVGNALATGSANGQGGAFGMLSNAGTLASTANTLSGGWLGNSLGITGPNGVFSGNGMLSGAYNYLFGAGAGSTNAATLAAQPIGFASDAANAATYGSTSPGIFSSGGAVSNIINTPVLGSTLGLYASGIGAGYGIGSLAGGYLQSALGKTGPAPQIGAGVGAVGGALAGTFIFPGVGTVLGGVLGGALGGAGGGLIGPHKANEFSSVSLTAPGGFLDLSHPVSQLDSNFPAEVDQAHAYAAALNDLLTQSGIRLSLGGIKEIGTAAGPNKAADLASAFPKFQFTVPDTSTDLGRVLSGQVNGQSFSGLDQLQSVFTEVSTFVNQTVPALKAFDATSVGIGSLATALNNLHATFDPAIAEAQKLGYAETDLTTARDRALAAAQAQVEKQVASDQTGFQASYLASKAQVTGSSADAQAAALYAFDNVTAAQNRDQVKQEYRGIFGDAYASTAEYVQTSVALEQSLAEQRLAIQTQYTAQSAQAERQAAQAAGATITSLLSYVQKLQGSSVSPLSPLDQYAQARSQFNAVSGAARAGDYNSITNLPTYADALLSTSRNVNGSGIGYVNDYNSVLSSVSSVASLGPDALTQAFMAAQTAQLDGTLNRILSAIGDLQTALTRAAMAPARIAA